MPALMPAWLHVTLNFAVWKYGSMEEVKYGRMEEVKDEEVKDGRMEVGWDSRLYNLSSLREGLASETRLETDMVECVFAGTPTPGVYICQP